jgi:hypothetical protein
MEGWWSIGGAGNEGGGATPPSSRPTSHHFRAVLIARALRATSSTAGSRTAKPTNVAPLIGCPSCGNARSRSRWRRVSRQGRRALPAPVEAPAETTPAAPARSIRGGARPKHVYKEMRETLLKLREQVSRRTSSRSYSSAEEARKLLTAKAHKRGITARPLRGKPRRWPTRA